MEKYLKPERLDLDVKSSNAEEEYNHWMKTFENFLAAATKTDADVDKLVLLTNFITPKVYHYISDCTTYNDAITALKSLFVKKKNILCYE